MRAMGLGVLLGVASAGHAACGAPRVFWDAVLLRSWSVVVSCEHGERPAVFTSGGVAGTTMPTVRAGDKVRLWYRDGSVQMEMTGVAEESGVVGEVVKVRVMGRDLVVLERKGVVRGSGELEMVR